MIKEKSKLNESVKIFKDCRKKCKKFANPLLLSVEQTTLFYIFVYSYVYIFLKILDVETGEGVETKLSIYIMYTN